MRLLLILLLFAARAQSQLVTLQYHDADELKTKAYADSILAAARAQDSARAIARESAISAPGGSIPAGVIVMWSGTIANIPEGWQLCDGTNGSPDLRSRFIKGSAAGDNPGVTGGDSVHTPSGTNSAPALTMNAYTPAGTVSAISATQTGAVKVGTSSTTASANSHTHPAPTFTGAQATLTGSVAAPAFTGTSQNTEPMYYSLAFIIKL